MFAVKFAVGEKRGLGRKTNKCVLYYRRSENFPIGGNPAGHASRLLPKVPWALQSQSGLASCHGGFQQGAAVLSYGQPCLHSLPWLPSLQQTLPTARQAELRLLPSPTLKCASTIFRGFQLCLLPVHPAEFKFSPLGVLLPDALQWSFFIPFFFPYYSPHFICLLAIHLFLCWLLFLPWFFSLSKTRLQIHTLKLVFHVHFSCISPALSLHLNCCLLCPLDANKWTVGLG